MPQTDPRVLTSPHLLNLLHPVQTEVALPRSLVSDGASRLHVPEAKHLLCTTKALQRRALPRQAHRHQLRCIVQEVLQATFQGLRGCSGLQLQALPGPPGPPGASKICKFEHHKKTHGLAKDFIYIYIGKEGIEFRFV